MDLELERWAHLQRPRRLVMVLASPRMTTHPLHQAAADGEAFSTLQLIPTPSQPGQQHDDGNGDQPTHGDNGLGEQRRRHRLLQPCSFPSSMQQVGMQSRQA